VNCDAAATRAGDSVLLAKELRAVAIGISVGFSHL
jgi:hypothetical protein